MPQLVSSRQWGWALIWLCLAGAFFGFMVGDRVDTRRVVTAKMAKEGSLAKASERELSEAIQQEQRVTLVAGVAKGLLGMPVFVFFIAVALKVLAWLLGRKALIADTWSAACVAMLPVALSFLLAGLAATTYEALTPAQIPQLLPSSLAALISDAGPKLMRVWSAVDIFAVWAAVLLGLGFAAASHMKRSAGVAYGLLLWVLYSATFQIGLPGLMAAQGGR
ncbi:MAG: YIP1 family protein [Myxococcaceae bacterium]|nr:YIP1 family protein [Myxococcaceae bacterium]